MYSSNLIFFRAAGLLYDTVVGRAPIDTARRARDFRSRSENLKLRDLHEVSSEKLYLISRVNGCGTLFVFSNLGKETVFLLRPHGAARVARGRRAAMRARIPHLIRIAQHTHKVVYIRSRRFHRARATPSRGGSSMWLTAGRFVADPM
jgi:hypothetical protein